MAKQMVHFDAKNYVDPDGLIVRSGELLARGVLAALRHGDSVHVNLAGLCGISSSYFNMFLHTIRTELGAEALGRVQMEFVSPLQRQVYVRSLEAVLKESGIALADS
ncbi:MAG: hypothetical protein WBD40_07390 [Tepidisphaeraceae bacterium]